MFERLNWRLKAIVFAVLAIVWGFGIFALVQKYCETGEKTEADRANEILHGGSPEEIQVYYRSR